MKGSIVMEKTKVTGKLIIEMIVIILSMTFVFHYVILPIKVEGESMYPTLHDNDTAMVSALNLDQNDIERFDIVVLQCDVLNKKIIKRVIGLPGETIVYKNDCLYINGIYYEENFLDQDYIKSAKEQYNATLFTNDFDIVLQDDEIFVLGDNRLKSADSRSLGVFHYQDILGKRGLVVFPFHNMKWME